MFPIERRRHLREPIALRLCLHDGQHARTSNVCEDGLYVIVPAGARLGRWVTLELVLPHADLRLRAEAEVVRTEAIGRGLGVALRVDGLGLHSIR